ncbi:MAG: hypothetical protein Ta2D_08490 [Rickettsiales bacterium]|nr:MAG: hypothetical protein Ta2D_08490 [Rickettsiales bacterium]
MNEKLFNEFLDSKLHHSLLLIGRRGVGKFKLANELGKKILSHTATINNTEELIKLNKHPDFLIIEKDEKEKIIKVDCINTIKDFIQLSPTYSKNKIIIINAVDEMNEQTQNAILKMVEEPQPNTFFLLICHNINNVLITIKSRCRKVNVPPLDFLAWKKEMIRGGEDLYDLSGGSVYYGNLILDNDGIKIKNDIADLLKEKKLNIENLHIFADSILREKEEEGEVKKKKSKNNVKFSIFYEILLHLLYTALKCKSTEKQNEELKDFINKNSEKMLLDKIFFVKELLNDTERIYLDKKHSIIMCFLELSK